MAKVIKPPNSLSNIQGKSVFLAGTIDNGNSIDWQELVEAKINDLNITILNPRRNQWDSTWVQSITNKDFKEQVEWELSALDLASIIFMYFASGSTSPISLLELGLHALSGKVIIVCPEGFWKKGNVDIVSIKYGIPLFNDIESGIEFLREKLQ